ncbi:BnaC07g32460D [Brassica napus]|uniref:BnaC07g32460D protein n=1 Tax=Brassica napus TaxID=3708 RepID=A0A078GRC7_BRANA|nr:BnaC07g32460D [Brassica napus]
MGSGMCGRGAQTESVKLQTNMKRTYGYRKLRNLIRCYLSNNK